MIKIGIIGGSGLDDPKLLENPSEIEAVTAYGAPSSGLTTGEIAGVPVVIIARHAKNHSINPTNVPYRANIQALKDQGCTHIIATSACGSLREEMAPGHIVFPDQFIDWTKKRNTTFFDSSTVMHCPMSEPFCPELRKLFVDTAQQMGLTHHKTGTVITIEGPRFSTKAESNMFRSLNADIINMSTVPEVCLAREAGIHYQVIAMSTDYDCWKDDEEPVTMDMILATMSKNAQNVKQLIIESLPKIAEYADVCKAHL